MFLLFLQVSHSCHRADGAVLLSPRRALLFLGDAGPPGGAAESRVGGEGVLEGHHLQDAHSAQRAGEAAGEGEDGTGVTAVPSSAAAARWKTHKPVVFCALGTVEGDGGRGQGRVHPKVLGGRATRRRQRERGAGSSEGEGPSSAFRLRARAGRTDLRLRQSALLEEQASVMEHCAAERRRLDAEWANFHSAEKQRQEQQEREVSSLLEKRESAIISLANVSVHAPVLHAAVGTKLLRLIHCGTL